MPDDARSGLRVTPGLVVPEAELSWRFSRSSGPGGQGVNTADSRVELSFLMYGFFNTVPRELDEAAKLDGATHAQIYWTIILRLVAPILA
ncbi:ABC transporter permease subunit, partial [Cellulosimicrobium cellulans]|uniref:ABC transporter permease subunit n=1 Tax=Cellulosimicrobium cellulans TaxID=1710 RepID=UPI00209AD348